MSNFFGWSDDANNPLDELGKQLQKMFDNAAARAPRQVPALPKNDEQVRQPTAFVDGESFVVTGVDVKPYPFSPTHHPDYIEATRNDDGSIALRRHIFVQLNTFERNVNYYVPVDKMGVFNELVKASAYTLARARANIIVETLKDVAAALETKGMFDAHGVVRLMVERAVKVYTAKGEL